MTWKFFGTKYLNPSLMQVYKKCRVNYEAKEPELTRSVSYYLNECSEKMPAKFMLPSMIYRKKPRITVIKHVGKNLKRIVKGDFRAY